jgi:hypothetical protein
MSNGASPSLSPGHLVSTGFGQQLLPKRTHVEEADE